MNSQLFCRPAAHRGRLVAAVRGKPHGFATRRKPQGFTLVEVGIAATVAAVVMAGATALLVGMFRSNGTMHERLEQIAVRSHLADRFRADVAAARSCTLDEKQPEGGILLRGDDEHSVRYRTGEHDVQRIAESGERVTARETFHLGDRRRAVLTLTTDVVRVVRCTIEQMPPPGEPENPVAGAIPRPALTIAAVLGREPRLAEKVRQTAARPKADPDPAPSTELPTP